MNLITRAKDANKDQTYFIWQIKQEQLPHILFPVGEYDVKSDVRFFAESKGLITSNKPDSQGLCFVGQTSLRDMLLQTLGRKDGFIYTYLSQEQIDKIGLKVTKKTRGEVNALGQFKIQLGSHQGAFLYTIGQRQNLGISNGPWFVSEVDIVNNEVIVCHNEFQTDMESNVLLVKDLNWHLDITQKLIYTKSKEVLMNSEKQKVKNVFSDLDALTLDNYKVFKLRLKGQIRYRSEARACEVFVFVPQLDEGLNLPQKILNRVRSDTLEVKVQTHGGDTVVAVTNAPFAIVQFDKPIRAAAKGQSIVFYDYDTDQYLIGGGVMEKAYKASWD
jgi:tRNA U34 2-thiouridine synthase MnmA/TrmU